jgi:hypothetical protein
VEQGDGIVGDEEFERQTVRNGQTMSALDEDEKYVLARYYHELNCWRWPEDWGPPSVDVAECLAREGRAKYFGYKTLGLNNLCELLRHLVGDYIVSRVWWLEYLNRTETEFQQWWGAIRNKD